MSLRALLACSTLHAATAALVSNVFGSHMVLQRDKPVPVWGWTTAGAFVHGTLGGSGVQTALADSEGFWRVVFPAISVGGGALTLQMASSSGETATLVDILAGDVILCRCARRWRIAPVHLFPKRASTRPLPPCAHLTVSPP